MFGIKDARLKDDLADRIKKVQAAMAEENLDAILITGFPIYCI